MSSQNSPLHGVESILGPLRASASPLLVWHGAPGERVELSGRVFDNWVAKSANLLAEEYDAGPGTSVAFAAPAHWKTLALAFAAWQLGARVSVVEAAEAAGTAADVVVTDAPDQVVADEILAVALGSLALDFGAELPAGALDYAAEVRSFADVAFPEQVAADAEALSTSCGTTTFGELLAPERAGATGTAAFVADEHEASGDEPALGAALRAAVVLFKQGDALVLFGRGVEASERLLAQERAVRRV
ncbi:TIGR03089 family protein [Zhihengliuella salsuginis]|uniref:TIGR03089 family protein n=1 Tax=Zhihengliuella salsuginis TaxID=578222 RepID=A0ABQ3GJN1_9MICC|nr:TIGR03089 family protein [Zhihengliuella salsuginis]GHD09658.1 TIGR03089 family protein [Zhihengliuella salsuginis]